MTEYIKRVSLILLFVFSGISTFWVLSIDNSFCFDDTSWMYKVSTMSYDEIFTVFPHSAYLDRPIGIMFLKVLYDLFGLDYTLHHAMLMMIHLLNVLLVFIIFKKVCARKDGINDNAFWSGLLAAAFFGIWARTHMAVQWDAAIFDLLGTFLSLLSMWFYLQYRTSEKYRGQNLILTLFFYYLAIRTKEMFLIIPFLFVLYEIWEMTLEKQLKQITAVTKSCCVIFSIFFGLIVYCKLQGSITNDVTNPYYQSFNLILLLKNLFYYCMLCFDLEGTGWNYVFSVSGLIGLVILLLGFVFSIYKILYQKKCELFLCYIALCFSVVIVLPMVNQTHVLYLYFPAIFIGLLFATLINSVKKKDLVVIILMCAFLTTNFTTSTLNIRDYWISISKMEKMAWEDIQEITAPIPETTIYIRNTDNLAYTPFFYGEGAICKLLYHDETLKVIELDSDEIVTFEKPYVLWNYENGHIVELERNTDRTLSILDVYSEYQADGSLILGIVPDKFTDMMKIYVNGKEQVTIVGDTFISAHILQEDINTQADLSIYISDKYETKSEEYILTIN